MTLCLELARLHSDRRGKSHSTRPSSKRAPSWVNYSQDEIIAVIGKLSKEGLGPSEIGLRMRDEYGIPQTKTYLGKSIAEVLKEDKNASSLPEDLAHLVESAARLKAHLNAHHSDRKNVRSLELLEAKIHRLSNYYKRKKTLSPSWKFAAAVAQLA